MNKKELTYTIYGKKIDKNPLSLSQQNILWRSSKSFDAIQQILEIVQEDIRKTLKNLNVPLESYKIFNISQESKQCNKEEKLSSNAQKTKRLSSMKETYQDKVILQQLHGRKSHFLCAKTLKKALQKQLALKNRYLLFSSIKKQSRTIQKYFDKKLSQDTTNLLQKKEDSLTAFQININMFLCKNKDWIQEYQASIQPIVCNGFYIRPSWHQPNAHYRNIVIDPSLSFGSGHHATTAICIDFLSTLYLHNKSLLDIGCGSGILSLIGASLGAKVYACDTDLNACKQSVINFYNNNLQYANIWHGSIEQCSKNEKIPKQYDCICANIVTSVILILKDSIQESLQSNGILILSGILEEHEGKILHAFCQLDLIEKKQIDEWIGIKFIKK